MNKLSQIIIIIVFVIISGTANFFFSPYAHAASDLYNKGFAKGIQLADANFRCCGPESSHVNPNDLDCDSDVDPLEANEQYCDGVNHGYEVIETGINLKIDRSTERRIT
jgi:hypothetical protein